MVETGKVARGSYLLVESFDRLSRQQVRKSIGPFIDIINAGIIVVTLGDLQIYSESSVDDNFAQLILSLAIMSRAHEESQTRSIRLKEAYENRRKRAIAGQGRFANKMWGWLDEVKLGSDQFAYIPNEHAKTIQRIFELADLGLGHLVITRRLNECNTPTVRGSSAGWQQPTISKILKNEAVIGTYQPICTVDGKRNPYGNPIPNYLPAVVSEELYWRVQRNKKNRLSKTKQGRRLTNIFGPIAVCGSCHSNMRLKDSSYCGISQKYLRCDAKYRGVHCLGSRRGFRYDLVENAVFDSLDKFGFDPALNDGATIRLRSEFSETILGKSAMLEDLEGRRRRLIEFAEVADTDEERREIFNRMKRQRIEIEDLKAQVAELQGKVDYLEKEEAQIAGIRDFIHTQRQTWSGKCDMDVHESRSKVSQILTQFFERLIFNTTERQFTVVMVGGARTYTFKYNRGYPAQLQSANVHSGASLSVSRPA